MRPRKPMFSAATRRGLAALTCGLALGACPGLAAAQTAGRAPALPENGYRIELLIFARTDAESLTEEAFDPLPALAYPPRYRFLIDPELADARLRDGFSASRFDDRGVQVLTVAEPPSALDPTARPDSLTETPPDPEATAPGATQEEGRGTDTMATGDVAGAGTSAAAGEPAVDPNAPLLAPPYLLLPRSNLEFSYQTTLLRRRGQEVLFHGAWWAPLEERESALPVVLERASDPDSTGWPQLQGSLLFYLSRFLHVEADLWLNTDGGYLPPAWTIPAPPLPGISLRAQWRDGRRAPLDPVRPTLNTLLLQGQRNAMDPIRADGLIAGLPRVFEAPYGERDGIGTGDEGIEAAADTEFPYRHAITHRQTRRMRSGELHYLDHPVLGIVLRVVPVNRENLPLLKADWLPFLERHQLPVRRWPRAVKDN